nr:stage II sporulation protein P [Cohnella faecalis]
MFIYHSHNRESWFPELKAGTKDANSGNMNITLVGKRLSAQLEKNGIGTVHSNKDYVGTVKDYNWNFSYKYSLQTLRQAVSQNKQLKFFFDIHRDSLRRNKTTTTIGGRDYAQVFFIIGHRNPNWKENEAFATAIHEQLEKDYPAYPEGFGARLRRRATGNITNRLPRTACSSRSEA